MTMMRRPSPFGELLSLRQAMDRLFEDSYVRPRAGESEGHAIPLDIYTTPDSLVLEAALPGVKPENVDINVLGDTLTISGSTHEETRRDEAGVLYQEVRRGTFSRTVTLPSGLRTDAATARFENGMLRLEIPKAEAAKPRQIRISPTTEGSATGTVSTSTPEAGQGRQPERELVGSAAGGSHDGTTNSQGGGA